LRPAGIIFLQAEGGRNNPTRLDGKIRSTAERKIFTDHPRRQPALAERNGRFTFAEK